MPASRSVPTAAVIARELDRLTIPTQQKKLPSTFLQSFSVKERLKDLSVDRLPELNPSLDCACTKALTSAERTAVKLANDALLVFSRLAYLIEHDNPALRSMMLQMWDSGAWKWMLFLYNSGVDLNESISNDSESERIPLTRQVVAVAIVDALVGCSDSDTLGKRLIRVPDIVALTARLWVEDLPIPGRVSMVHKELTFAMYHIMSDSQDDTALSSLMDAVDGGADTIISAASNHLRRLASSTPLVLKDLDSQFQFMQFITKKSALRDAMHRGDTLSIALSVIDALTKNSVKIPTAHEMVVSCIDSILLPHLLSGADVKPLIQSINNGLLRTIYDARVAFDRYEECCGALEEVLIQIVGPSLVFRSVLHAVERSENKTNFFASYRSGKSEFGEWETLHEVYQQMVQFKHSLDEHPEPCGFMDCQTNEVDMVIKLQRCAKCQYEKYCSQECQKKDWPRHKLYCRREDAGEITPVSDREFVRDLAEFEVRKDIQSLVERVKKNPALQTPLPLMFQVDFTTLDRNISIGVAPGRPTTADNERTAAIYAKIQNGREATRSLGRVTGWKELQTSSQPGHILYPAKFLKMIE